MISHIKRKDLNEKMDKLSINKNLSSSRKNIKNNFKYNKSYSISSSKLNLKIKNPSSYFVELNNKKLNSSKEKAKIESYSKKKTFKTLNLNESNMSSNNKKRKVEMKIDNNKYRISYKNKKIKFYNNIDRELNNAFKLRLKEKKDSMRNFRKKFETLNDKSLNLKQQEKLKNLKNLLFWIERKQKTIGTQNKEIINLDNSKKLNFIRSKNLNQYIPSVNYNKNNLYYNKKYDLILDNIEQKSYNNTNNDFYNVNSNSFDVKFFSPEKFKKISSTKVISKEKKEDKKVKTKKLKIKEKFLNHNSLKDEDDKKDISSKDIDNNEDKKRQYSLSNFHRNTRKEVEINQSEKKKRSKSSYKISNYSKNLKDDYIKTLLPLTQRLITESNFINEQISTERKNDKCYDHFGEENTKEVKKNKIKYKKAVNINKIREDIKLYNTKSYIDEENIVFKGVKRIEKLLTNKKEVRLARSIAQRVINEDILTHNYFNYDATYNVRIKQLGERKLFSKFAGDTAASKNKMDNKKTQKTESQKMFKLVKGNLDNFFDKKSLEFLIFKYKATHLRIGKI
jgi:hypothetical protein